MTERLQTIISLCIERGFDFEHIASDRFVRVRKCFSCNYVYYYYLEEVEGQYEEVMRYLENS